jgi:hypothetical protein
MTKPKPTGLDPDGRYPSEGPRRVDVNAARALAALPGATVTRTRDVVQFDLDLDESGVTVLVTVEAIEFRLPTVEWTTGYAGPAASSRLWKRVPWASIGASDERLASLVEMALARRRRDYATCRYCRSRGSD